MSLGLKSEQMFCFVLFLLYFLFLVVLVLHCCARGLSLIDSLFAVCRLLIEVASLAAEHGLWGPRASVVAAPRL